MLAGSALYVSIGGPGQVNSAGRAKLDDYIAVTFTVSPQVRAIKFHQPEALSPEEYCFVYNVAPEGKGPDGRIFGALIRDAMISLDDDI